MKRQPIVLVCAKCQQKNRVPVERLDKEARCGACGTVLDPTTAPLVFNSVDDMVLSVVRPEQVIAVSQGTVEITEQNPEGFPWEWLVLGGAFAAGFLLPGDVAEFLPLLIPGGMLLFGVVLLVRLRLRGLKAVSSPVVLTRGALIVFDGVAYDIRSEQFATGGAIVLDLRELGAGNGDPSAALDLLFPTVKSVAGFVVKPVVRTIVSKAFDAVDFEVAEEARIRITGRAVGIHKEGFRHPTLAARSTSVSELFKAALPGVSTAPRGP